MAKVSRPPPDQEIATLRVCFAGRQSISRDVEIRASSSLYALAEAIIIDAFGWDMDHAFGFFDDVLNPYMSKNRYELFADMKDCDDYRSQSKSVKKTKIRDVFDAPGKKMLFLFDYGDEDLFTVEIISFSAKEPRVGYPMVSNCKGESPEQYP